MAYSALRFVRTHQEIDQRSLAMAKAIVDKLDRDPEHSGLTRARSTCRRWYEERRLPAVREWMDILERPWSEIRLILLDDSEEGQRLRQSDSFRGVLTPRERWRIYKTHHEASRA